jgi:hypothetical protein
MLLLTQDAHLVCKHENGAVQIVASQKLVTINRRKILVASDPEGRTINGCPMYGPTIKPCTTTLAVQQGYSTLLRIQSHRVCLDTVSGLTDGTPPGTVLYEVRQAGQGFVKELS